MRSSVEYLMCIVMVGALVISSATVSAQTDITELLKDIQPGVGFSSPAQLTDVGGVLYFTAYDGLNGIELWKSDGTPSGTALVKDINPGASHSNISNITNFGGVLFFRADDGTNGFELWKSDGTPSGTVMVKDINPGAASSNPNYLTRVGGVLYFSANNGIDGIELWKSNGTASTTVIFKDINPGAGNSSPSYISDVGGVVYFQANDGTNGIELWKSDGSVVGTVMVKDINPGALSSNPFQLTDFGGVLYFGAGDIANGFELWKSDGTDSGTVLVKDIYPGGAGSNPTQFTDVGGVLYFRANDGTNGYELWKSDGTPSGTVMVKDIIPGVSSSGPTDLTELDGVLYFRADDSTDGMEFWKSDGTPSGTVLVKDIYPGGAGSNPGGFTSVGSVLYFQADDGTNGYELWKSDGTPSGTVMVKDIYPGPSGSDPEKFTDFGGVLYFRALDGVHGYELWKNFTQDQVGTILSVNDIPDDQGGRVRLSWNKSRWDTTDGSGHVILYGIWRRIPAGNALSNRNVRLPVYLLNNDTLLAGYDILMSVPAVRIPHYQAELTTLGDSSGSGFNYSTFLITAHTTDINYYYISRPDSGYSVDNLSPIPPAGLLASVVAGPQVELSWTSPTDPDVGYYDVHRSGTSGFTPDGGNKIGTAYSTNYTDSSPISGSHSYYRIIAVDIHDNSSPPSNEAEAAVTVNRQFNVNERWNIVSLPLTMSDYTKTVLFPTATTSAFTFDGGYVAYGILQDGVGYWMKFSSGETISHDGLGRTVDTIAVTEGWNMVGSLSSSLIISNVSSIPGGIVTSPFYKYDNGYTASGTIEPGQGYWVKVSQAGQLVMSTTSAPPGNRIRIEDTGELPPPPPDEISSVLPDAYSLEQNYPNPFNPVTNIRYSLPISQYIRLSVFNMLGQEVAVLVNESQEAGYRTVSFDATNLPSGVYTYRITAGTFTDGKKMLLLK